MAEELSTKQQVETFITDRIDEANKYAQGAWDLLAPFLLAAENAYSAVDIPEVPTDEIVFPDYNYDPTTLDDDPAAPDTSIDTSMVTRPTLNKVSVDRVMVDAAPSFTEDTPETSLAYSEVDYVSVLLDSFKTKLATDLQGGTGLSTVAEQAIYDRARNRLRQDYADECRTIRDRFGSMGWNFMVGPMNMQIAEAKRKHERRLDDLNRDIVVQTSSLEQDNRKQVEGAILQLQQLLIAAHDAKRGRLLQAATTNVGNAINLYNASVSKYNTLMNAYKIEADVQIATVSSQLETNKTNAQTYAAELDARKIDITALIEEAKGKADIYRALMAGFTEKARYLSTIEETKIREYEAKGNLAVKNAEVLLKRAEAEISAAINKMAMQVEAAKSGASVAAQIVASALNSVNASTSLGFDSGSRYSHSYDETKETAEGVSRSVSARYELEPDETPPFDMPD